MKTWGSLACVAAMGVFLAAAGCNRGGGEFQPYKPEGEVVDAHDHAHEHGPHDGHLIELGKEEYHAELVFDKPTRKITVYVLDSGAKKPVAIDQPEITLNLKVADKPVQLKLKAMPQQGEPAGSASRFEVEGAGVPESIHDEEEIQGRLNLKVKGTDYVGEIAHDDHHHDEKK